MRADCLRGALQLVRGRSQNRQIPGVRGSGDLALRFNDRGTEPARMGNRSLRSPHLPKPQVRCGR